ncbi:Conserved_hypothetical protein [Hexamita inflata]|uniref:Smr domain-containing protein n=2 Tax=Hexamita inflata TaxID=28002 RepID=A0AA86QRS4_9EUKA|nr:Conserved hypothetical protein [Hexamita inflata]CAI9963405.1 Conserved hypothetical protein [Hexamita inflata]
MQLPPINSELDEQTLNQMVIETLNQKHSDDELQEVLLDLLGFDNIEVIGELISNRYSYAIPKQNNEQHYQHCIDLMVEISGWPRNEAKYHLSRFNYNLNEALDQYYLSQQKNVLIDENGNEISPDSPDQPTEFVQTSNVEQIAANLQLIDTQRITQPWFRQFELDLHEMGVNEAVDAVRTKVNELVEMQQDYYNKGKKVSINLKIITGRGVHSEAAPVIKVNVLRLIKAHGMSHTIQQSTKGGVIVVRIKPETHMI